MSTPQQALTYLRHHRRILLHALLFPGLILLVNLLIVAKEFKVDYSAYLESNEGTFIAIARLIAAHPGDMLWWPTWDFGIPFQNTYVPGLPVLVAAFSRLTGHSASLSFHQVCAFFFAFGPVAVYFMAWGVSRLPGTSALAALAYSLFSPCAWLVPEVRADLGGAWNLRRLQILSYYGEGPHTASLFFLPLAILFLYLALTRRELSIKVAAGVCLGLTVLMNAFGATLAIMVVVALLAAGPRKEMWRNSWLIFFIGLLSYLWISPLLPPSVVQDIRRNGPTTAGLYPFNAVSALGLGDIAFALLVSWLVTAKKVSRPLRMFLFYSLIVSAVMLLSYYADCNIVPQPHRYSVAMDMALCVLGVFGGAALLRAIAPSLLPPVAIVLLLGSAVQLRHDVHYGRAFIQGQDVKTTTTYHVAEWMNDHMHGERVFMGGAQGFHFNAFADTPQVHGGHDPMQPSLVPLVAEFIVQSGMNTGSRDAEICTIWLKALGAHAISVPGPKTDSYYKAFLSPLKFEGVLPVLWRESDDTVYEVPQRSSSLAHVVPENTLVQHPPYNGLDVAELSRYVSAIEDPALPEAPFHWLNRHSATIQATLQPGQLISVQEREMPGWNATANGKSLPIGKDGLGFMVLQPECRSCSITLNYDGGIEWRGTCMASLAVIIGVVYSLFLKRKSPNTPEIP
jgi:hypothetical protein